MRSFKEIIFIENKFMVSILSIPEGPNLILEGWSWWFKVRFYCNVTSNLEMIGIAMTFLENNFSFISNLYFMRYMHANTKNKIWTFKEKIIFNFCYFN